MFEGLGDPRSAGLQGLSKCSTEGGSRRWRNGEVSGSPPLHAPEQIPVCIAEQLYSTTRLLEQQISIREYVDHMPADQFEIYVAARREFHLAFIANKGFKVLPYGSEPSEMDDFNGLKVVHVEDPSSLCFAASHS